MRDSIPPMIPASLPADRHVLVIAAQEPGIDSVKRVISDLNRDKEWIRAEYRGEVPASKVTPKIGFVMMLGSISHMTLKQIRATSLSQGIPNIPFTVTVGEAKEVLQILSERREKPVAGEPEANGHASHANGNGTQERAEAPLVESQPASQMNDASDLEKSFDAMDDLQKIIEASGGHLIRIIERCKEADQRCKELEQMMRNKDADYKLVQDENTRLRAKVAALEEKQSQIAAGLQALENLQKIAASK